MSADDEVFSQPGAVATELIREASYDVAFTSHRSTSCWKALVKGLAEYISQLRTQHAGKEVRLLDVSQGWADPEQFSKYPSAAIYSEEPGLYDGSAFTVVHDRLQDGRVLMRASEFTQRLTLDVWCTSDAERTALVAMLEDALDPVDWMSGFRLRLPHYHNAVATFLKDGISHADTAEQGNRRWRAASFTIQATVPQIRFVGQAPALDVRVNAEVTDA